MTSSTAPSKTSEIMTRARNNHPPRRTKPEVNSKFDLANYTYFERMQFIYSGLYPLASTATAKAKLINNLRFIIILITAFILFISMVISLAIEVESLSDAVEILYYLITQTAYILKLANFLLNRHRLPEMEEHVQHPIIYRYYHIFGIDGLEDVSRMCVKTGRLFRGCVIGCCIFYVVVPIVSPTRILPLGGWFPIDKEDNVVILFVTQIVSLLFSAATNVAIDIYASHCISLVVGEFRLLKTCLMNIDYRLDDYEGDDDGNVNIVDEWELVGHRMDKDEEELPKLRPGHLKNLVYIHKHAITLINMIESTFSYGIFVQFLASMAVICLSGFQMLMVPTGSIEFQLFLFYCLSMTFQISGYCYIGNEVISESTSTSEGCYMSNWYEAKRRHKTTLLIVMERAKKEIALSAGKFFFLSLATYVSILKTSYSYFAVLRRVYKDI